jgi:NAD(P)H-dependent flavin oxidoreductase YrpB (nitropropane dioxygenase family)
MKIRDKELQLPIIQGGMGVGVSLSSLAGNVARQGGMGVISSVNIGFKDPEFEKNPVEANLRCLRSEILKAKEIAGANGLVAVNVMVAVSNYEQTVKCAIEAGADAIISGAGLPLKLGELTKGTDTLFAPIVSSGKAASLLCRSYQKKNDVIPDFIVIEGHKAGGHLGFSAEELSAHTYKENEEILSEVLEAIAPFEAAYGYKIPVFIAGGVFDGADMAHFTRLGASGVQMATRFIATYECDAAEEFKQQIVNAKKEDIIIIESPVGMPARAINSPLLKRLKAHGKFPALKCNACLTACKKGELTPYCISRALIEAVKGNVQDGLFFCGENADRVERIMSVEELMNEIAVQWRENL